MTSLYNKWTERKFTKDCIDQYGHRFSVLYFQIKNLKRKITYLQQNLYKYKIFSKYQYIPTYLLIKNGYYRTQYSKHFAKIQNNIFRYHISQLKNKLGNFKSQYHKLLDLYFHNFPLENSIDMLKVINKYTVHLDLLFVKKIKKTENWLINKLQNSRKNLKRYKQNNKQQLNPHPLPPPPFNELTKNNPTSEIIVIKPTVNHKSSPISTNSFLKNLNLPPPLPITPTQSFPKISIQKSSNPILQKTYLSTKFQNPNIIHQNIFMKPHFTPSQKPPSSPSFNISSFNLISNKPKIPHKEPQTCLSNLLNTNINPPQILFSRPTCMTTSKSQYDVTNAQFEYHIDSLVHMCLRRVFGICDVKIITDIMEFDDLTNLRFKTSNIWYLDYEYKQYQFLQMDYHKFQTLLGKFKYFLGNNFYFFKNIFKTTTQFYYSKPIIINRDLLRKDTNTNSCFEHGIMLVPPFPPIQNSSFLKTIQKQNTRFGFIDSIILHNYEFSFHFIIFCQSILFSIPPPIPKPSPPQPPTLFSINSFSISNNKIPSLFILSHSAMTKYLYQFTIIFLSQINLYLQHGNPMLDQFDCLDRKSFNGAIKKTNRNLFYYPLYPDNIFFRKCVKIMFPTEKSYPDIKYNLHDYINQFLEKHMGNQNACNRLRFVSYNKNSDDSKFHNDRFLSNNASENMALLSLSHSVSFLPPKSPSPQINNPLILNGSSQHMSVKQSQSLTTCSKEIHQEYKLIIKDFSDVKFNLGKNNTSANIEQTIPKAIDENFKFDFNIILPVNYPNQNIEKLQCNQTLQQIQYTSTTNIAPPSPSLTPNFIPDFLKPNPLFKNQNGKQHVIDAFVNTTHITFTDKQIQFLSSGPKATYAPPPPSNIAMPTSRALYSTDIEYILRNVFLKNPNINQNIESFKENKHLAEITSKLNKAYQQPKQNEIQKDQYKKLKEIKQNLQDNNAIIVLADKSNSLVAVSKTDYNTGMQEALKKNQFISIKKDLGLNRATKLKKHLFELLKNGIISESQHKKLYPTSHNPCMIYGRYKSHKAQGGYRPLVDTSSSYFSPTSKWLLSFLKRYNNMAYHVKNSSDFISKIRGLNMDADTHLMSLDVESMYGSINLDLSIDYIIQRYRMDPCKAVDMPIRDLVYLLDLCTKQITTLFGNQLFSQVGGILMGHPLGGLMADIHISIIEAGVMEIVGIGMHIDISIMSIYRYADDLLLIINHHKHAQTILNIFNQIDPTIIFTKEDSEGGHINYLDLSLYKVDNSLQYSLYRKPTQNSIIINYYSDYPYKIKANIIKQEILRCYRLSSSEYFLSVELNYIKQIFLINNYPIKLIEKTIKQVGADWVNRFRLHPLSTSQRPLIPTFIHHTSNSSVNNHSNISNHDFNKSIYLQNLFNLQKSSQYIITPNTPPINRKDHIYIKINNIHFFNLLNPIFNIIKTIFIKDYPFLSNLNLVAQSPPTLKQFFQSIAIGGEGTQKGYNPSSVVYRFDCACAESYIGNTKRQFSLRVREHLMHDKNSKIQKHLESFACNVNSNNFKIISRQNNVTKRNILESILIRTHHPTLNITRGWDLLTSNL